VEYSPTVSPGGTGGVGAHYPTVDSPLLADYAHKGHKIHIRTINLNQPWQGIHQDLLVLVG
jgi:hypothetical protein